MNDKKTIWFKSLAATIIGGAASSALVVVVDPSKFNVDDLRTLGTIAGVGAISSLLGYLKKSPLPPE